MSIEPVPTFYAPRIAEIQESVSRYYGLSLLDMRSARRSRSVAHPRQIAMFLARELTPRSLPEIGKYFGDRDHSTVIHAIRAVSKRMVDYDTRHAVHFIAGELGRIVANRTPDDFECGRRA